MRYMSQSLGDINATVVAIRRSGTGELLYDLDRKEAVPSDKIRLRQAAVVHEGSDITSIKLKRFEKDVQEQRRLRFKLWQLKMQTSAQEAVA